MGIGNEEPHLQTKLIFFHHDDTKSKSSNYMYQHGKYIKTAVKRICTIHVSSGLKR